MTWDMVKLGDVANIITKGTTPTTLGYNFAETGVSFVKIESISLEGDLLNEKLQFISEECHNKLKRSQLQENDILFSIAGALGRVALVPKNILPANTNQALAIIRITNKRICLNFIVSVLKSKYIFDQFQKQKQGVAQLNLSLQNIADLQIPLPPLGEQKRIAAILDKAHNIRQKREQNLKNADALIKSIFLNMFGDPVTNPKRWEQGTIRDIVKEVNYGTSKPANEHGKYIYLRMNNITYEGQLNLTSVKYIDVSKKDFTKYSVFEGDILFNRTNSKELVGKTCVFKGGMPMIIAGYIIRVRVNERANPEYLSATLNSAYGKSTLYGMCKSIIGQANINAQELQNIKILIPPINLQNKFTEIVNKIEAQKAKQKEHLHEADQCFKALQQQFFG